MSLPTPAELQTLKYGFNGAPAAVLAGGATTTTTLAYGWQGAPVVSAVSGGTATVVRPIVFVVT
jgi:hypothetical protein